MNYRTVIRKEFKCIYLTFEAGEAYVVMEGDAPRPLRLRKLLPFWREYLAHPGCTCSVLPVGDTAVVSGRGTCPVHRSMIVKEVI